MVGEPYDLLFMNPGESPGSDWSYVMARNWDPSQNLNLGWVEWPQGPLTFDNNGEVPRWIEAWVVQSSTVPTQRTPQTSEGASQRTVQMSGWAPNRWTADGIPPGWINGSFVAGPAVGIALLAWRDGTTDKFDWWVDAINLY